MENKPQSKLDQITHLYNQLNDLEKTGINEAFIRMRMKQVTDLFELALNGEDVAIPANLADLPIQEVFGYDGGANTFTLPDQEG